MAATRTKEEASSKDVIPLDANFSITAPGVGSSNASYISKDPLGDCYSRSLTAANQILTSVTDGKGCRHHDHW